jgi:uncharacterized membrane protein
MNRPTSIHRKRQQSGTPPIGRLAFLDITRGFAIVMMVAYHFCFDLVMFHRADWNILGDANWIAWRTAILSSFLLVAGVSLTLRLHQQPEWRPFLLRWAQIAGAALLVSLGSAIMFPQTFIYFGVLHHMAVAMLVCRLALACSRWNIVLGLAIVIAAECFSSAAFDTRWLNWIGFMTHKPATQDYVPLFPWLGVMLTGCGLGTAMIEHRWLERDQAAQGADPKRNVGWVLRGTRLLEFAGRSSLLIYLVHQPILIGMLWLYQFARSVP